MRSSYTIPFRTQIMVPDHWEIPVMGGKCHINENGEGFAESLEIVFTGDLVTNAPELQQISNGEISAQITGRDHRLMFVRRHLENAMAFLECFHNIELATDEIEVRYEAESPEERAHILIHSMKSGTRKRPLPLTYDMFTRALMAAETTDGPHFQTTLAITARDALTRQRFIDSFRYSFLLIESLFGDGQFKTAGLKAALKRNAALIESVKSALDGDFIFKRDDHSHTKKLIELKASPAEIVDHLVERRGLYFHGNLKRKDSWDPKDQGEAQTLAYLSLLIVQDILQHAASKMFHNDLAKRHFEYAVAAGALLVFEVRFGFKEPDEQFERSGVFDIRTPGNKVTPRQANEIARNFLDHFEQNNPIAALVSAHCYLKGTEEEVFEIRFGPKPPPALPPAPGS